MTRMSKETVHAEEGSGLYNKNFMQFDDYNY